MTDHSEEAAQAAAESVRAHFARAEQAKTEEDQWNAKRKVSVRAVHGPRDPRDPNAQKFKHYWVPGHQVEIGGAPVEAEFTERQIHDMKLDPFVSVDDPNDQDQQAKKSAEAAEAKAKSVDDAKALLSSEGISTKAQSQSGVAPAAADALSELKAYKKDRR